MSTNVNPIPARTRKLSHLNIFSHWEVAELPRLLMPGEQVLCMISGFYTAGTATLCVTSHRLLLIDKKLIRLNFEDIRFEAIREVSYSRQLLIASVKFYYAGRELQFRSWYRRELRTLAEFVQNKMFEAGQGGGVPADVGAQQAAIDLHGGHTPEQIPLTAIQPSMSSTPPPVSRRLQRPFAWAQGSNRFQRWQRTSRFIERLPILQAASQ